VVFARAADDRLASLAGAINGLVEQQKQVNLRALVVITGDPAKEDLLKKIREMAEKRKIQIPLTIVKEDDKVVPVKVTKETPLVVVYYNKVKVVARETFNPEQYKGLSEDKIKELIGRFKKALVGAA